MSNEFNSVIAIPYVIEVVAFLVTVVIVVPVFKKLKISPILGYLAVGAVIGPYALSWVSDVNGVQHVAELGVIFLLFTIGLELSFERLKSFSRLIFGLGSLQVIVSALPIGLIAWFWGNTPQAAIIIGLCLALSSTAMVMQLLSEKGDNNAPYGRAAFAILLLQDLAVVPILILLSVLGSDDGESLWLSVGGSLTKAIVVVTIIIAFGRYALRYLFRMASNTRSVDVFTAMMLLTVLATSIATGLAGLSMALGAFLAGLLLAETEFRHQIESEIEPFKGLLLGLFFMGVGMNIDFVMALERGVWVLLSVAGLVVIKTLVATLIARLFLPQWGVSLRTSLMVSQAGEFAFVIIGQATLMYNLIPTEVGQFIVVVAGLSMAITPFLAWVGYSLEKEIDRELLQPTITNHDTQDLHGHVIIIGFGRVGQSVACVLDKQKVPYIAFDPNIQLVKSMREQGKLVFLGDGSKAEVMERAGAESASAVLITRNVVTSIDAKKAEHTVQVIRSRWATLPILVRARDLSHSHHLTDAGATCVVPETIEASLQLSGQILRTLGFPKEEANACIETIRRNHYESMPNAQT